jgi:hypothetical protein
MYEHNLQGTETPTNNKTKKSESLVNRMICLCALVLRRELEEAKAFHYFEDEVSLSGLADELNDWFETNGAMDCLTPQEVELLQLPFGEWDLEGGYSRSTIWQEALSIAQTKPEFSQGLQNCTGDISLPKSILSFIGKTLQRLETETEELVSLIDLVSSYEDTPE